MISQIQSQPPKFRQSDMQNDDANFLLGGGANNLGQSLEEGKRLYVKQQVQRQDDAKFMAPRFDDEGEEEQKQPV